MTERGLPSADASPACPFVAFEDERDERADRPDHRHRCYAESEPAPRALAHQEAYCLSSAFPVCPTFQEWARREAAHTRAGGTATPTPTAATVTPAAGSGDDTPGESEADAEEDVWEHRRDERPVEERPRRNPPRDWAAPPPWASGAGGLAGAGGIAGGAAAGAGGAAGAAGAAGAGRSGDASGTPDFLAAREAEGRGLAGSAADRLARGGGIADDPDDDFGSGGRSSREHPSSPADPELAGLVGRAGGGVRDARDGLPPVTRSGRPPTVSSTRDRDRERERERERAAERSAHDGPAWEGQRRYEAYPQIKARASMPGMPVPRIGILAGALVIGIVALFFLPALLGVGGSDEDTATPTPSAVATPTPEPTPVPAPTPQVYVIKTGDTLSKIARSFGLTLDQLLAANKDTIKDPDRIVVGDEIVIPVPVPEEVEGGTTSPSAAP
jgi:nucleoid-associated protein YgaU